MLEDSASRSAFGAADKTPVEELAGSCAHAAKGGLSENTERALRSDLTIYAAWCDARGLAALPANPDTIAAFVDDMAASRAPATVRRYVASVAAAHRSIGQGKPAGGEVVKRALRRMHRRKGRRQQQAGGLTWPLRERLLKVPGDRLIDARNRALLAVGYDTMLRRSELVELQVADLVVEVDGAATVLVRRGKADPEGRGAAVYLAADSVVLVRKWLGRAGIDDGRLFRSLCRGVLGERLDASQVPRIYKDMARRAGLPPEVVDGLSGHSTRVGPAQDMIASGIGLPAILHAGRWKTTTMVNRYGERLLARRSGAALLAQMQRR
ncbi:MAG: tyrosine-type recombinase/integrase [Gammaproteobacteria bacterium]|nr:tyrosine-type recombinase/integrase [Gammaproteobacteria bacterium]